MLAAKQLTAILYRLYAVVILGLYSVGVGIGAPANRAPSAADLPPWYTVDAQGELGVHLYFFWSTTCPHCKRAMPFLKTLKATYPWLQLQSLELTQHRAHVALGPRASFRKTTARRCALPSVPTPRSTQGSCPRDCTPGPGAAGAQKLAPGCLRR